VGFCDDLARFTDWVWLSGSNRWDDPQAAHLFEALSEVEAQRSIATRDDRDEELRTQRSFASAVERLPAFDRPYRVLYTAHSRRGAFAEMFQRFRAKEVVGPKTRWTHALRDAVLEDADDVAPSPDVRSGPGTGYVAEADVRGMFVGEIEIVIPECADLEHWQTVMFLRAPLLREARLNGLPDVNVGAILGNTLGFTRKVSEFLYGYDASFAGIHHGSTLGKPLENWAIFERPRGAGAIADAVCRTVSQELVSLADRELRSVLKELGVNVI
jgi:hypothetical protein